MARGASHAATVVSVAIVAYAAADVVHEAAYAVVSQWTGVGIISISTVALQSAGHSRLLSAAGTLADVIAGASALLAAAARRRFPHILGSEAGLGRRIGIRRGCGAGQYRKPKPSVVMLVEWPCS